MPSQDISKIKEKVRRLPHKPGVYIMRDRLGHIIYVGKAKDLKKRVSTYFQPSRKMATQQPKSYAMIPMIHEFEVVEVKSEPEALLLEGRLLKQWKPKYNTDFTDDKSFLLVQVDIQNPISKFQLCRFKKDALSKYFGPFAHAKLLRKTLEEMRRRFGILLGDTRPIQLPDGRWKLYDDVRSEIYGHTNLVTEDEYRYKVKAACEFLRGQSKEWLNDLKNEMKLAASNRNYEKASELRDICAALEKTVCKTRKFTHAHGAIKRFGSHIVLKELQLTLKLPKLPHYIECFDISHISGTFVVASMVQFKNGKPNSDQYRRYKIKSFIGNDDYRAMEEVVTRRYLRLYKENKAFPDLIVIDGGKGQLRSALRAFIINGLEPPTLIGLAKKHETVYFTDDRPPFNLSLKNEALRLLQRLRNEAHRFANTFNAETRSRKMKETILDEFYGLGPVRRKALLKQFKNINKLKVATPELLQQVDGIGPKLSHNLFRFLNKI